jgi:putative transcriptional regulator
MRDYRANCAKVDLLIHLPVDFYTISMFMSVVQEFEWNVDKAEANPRKHGISFQAARRVFSDGFAVEWPDLDLPYGEVRFIITGMVEGRLPKVVFTERDHRIGIISARKATTHEQENSIVARQASDGTLVEVLPDGTTPPLLGRTDWARVGAMTDEDVQAAVRADPDALPMTPEELAKSRRVPRVRTLRRAVGLTQEEFAARYHIPLGRLRDWEQGRTEPDQPARAYLK